MFTKIEKLFKLEWLKYGDISFTILIPSPQNLDSYLTYIHKFE